MEEELKRTKKNARRRMRKMNKPAPDETKIKREKQTQIETSIKISLTRATKREILQTIIVSAKTNDIETERKFVVDRSIRTLPTSTRSNKKWRHMKKIKIAKESIRLELVSAK